MNITTRKRKTRQNCVGEEEEENDDEERRGNPVLLWDLLVNNNDDICFKHILPRLNATDLKFLYEVNSETRKLIKRSTRESDLKKKFTVREMSSISTLEVAWENKSLWSGYLKDETDFSSRVAQVGARGEKV